MNILRTSTCAIIFFSTTFLLSSCSSSKKIAASPIESTISELKFKDVYVVPNAKQFKGTTIGGLSGIDYDAKRDVYYLISDDRSKINPARFYTAKIHINPSGIDSVEFTDVTTLKSKNGNPYPGVDEDAFHAPDPEALRYNPQDDDMVWSSEGERAMKKGKMVLEDPAVTIINKDGNYKDSFLLPANMHMSLEDKGPRRNGVFEGVSFADNYKYLYVSVEEPIYEDGPRAGVDTAAWIRIIKFDNKTHRPVAQYAYKVDPVPYPANPPDGYKINGISDILYIGNNKLLVIERAYSTGRLACNVKVYTADLTNASDISKVNSLKQDPPKNPAIKKLLFNFDMLNRYVDNVEGMTFGPPLPNGHRTFMFVVDDNFDRLEQTQFFMFEVIP